MEKYLGIYDNGYDDIYYITILAKDREQATYLFQMYLEMDCGEDLALNNGHLLVLIAAAFDDCTIRAKEDL